MKIKEFNNIREFAEEKTINKLIYNTMSYSEKKELKNYVYYVLNERKERQDLIWEYLNEPMDSEYYIYTALMISSYARRKK